MEHKRPLGRLDDAPARRLDDGETSALALFRGTLSVLLGELLYGEVVNEDTTTATIREPRRSLLRETLLAHARRRPIPPEHVLVVLRSSKRAECARPDDDGNLPSHLACATVTRCFQVARTFGQRNSSDDHQASRAVRRATE